MNTATQDRHALILLLSLVVFLVLSAFVTRDRTGEAILIISLGLTLAAAALELSDKPSMRWPGVLTAVTSSIFLLLCIVSPTHELLVATWIILGLTFAFVVVGLFAYLGRPGRITNGRIYASVSLYLMIATFYYAIFNLMEALNSGSFIEAGVAAGTPVHRHALLYFSLVTLTTLGYGDIVPATQPARIFAALEAITGVLYIAITVARLVAAYQIAADDAKD
jgi:Ion channel